MNKMNNEELVFRKLTPADLNATASGQVSALFEQLNTSITQQNAIEVLSNKDTVFVACLSRGEIVGMALMATYLVISGHKGMIEDVVVSEQYRGKGIGKKLIQALLQEAQVLQLSEILLFSGHHRTAAIALYTSLGFSLKNSGLYRLPLI